MVQLFRDICGKGVREDSTYLIREILIFLSPSPHPKEKWTNGTSTWLEPLLSSLQIDLIKVRLVDTGY